MLSRTLPYQWMTTLASAVAELQTRPLNAENWREDKFVLAVWNVLHQEILAKQNGRATIQQQNAQTPQTPKQQANGQWRGTTCQARQVFPMWRGRALGRILRQEGVHWRFPAGRRHQALGIGQRGCVRHQQTASHAVHKMWPHALVQGPLPDRGGSVKGRRGPGGPHWDPTVRDAWEALQHVRRLTHTDSGSSTGATTIRVVEPGSVDTYTSALRQALLAGTPDELLVDTVERRLNALAARGKSGSSATALISGVRLLEKLRIIQAVVTEVHWMQARAIRKGWARRAQPKPVTTWDHIEAITTSRGHSAWGRVVFLAIRSIVYLWRVGDAASVTWEWISVPGFVTFWHEKRNKKVTTYALSPFLEAWRAYL